MSVVEVVFVFVLIPLAILGVLALFTLWPKFGRTPRYRPGQEWPHPPVWWTPHPEGLPARRDPGDGPAGDMRRGGARGSW